MKELFKNKSFVLLFQGAMVSAIGTTLYGFAGGMYVMDLFPENDVNGKIGALFFAIVGASPILFRVLFSPMAGALVDKWNKIKILYMTDFIRGFLFLASLYILQSGIDKYEIIILFTIVGGLAGINEAFFGPAATSSIPDIVGDDQIQAAQGAQSIIGSVTGIVGVAAGAVFYVALGIQVAILVNTISFFLSALSEMFIRTKYKHEISKEDRKLSEDIKSGLSYMKEKTGLLNMMKYSLIINFAFTPLFAVGIPFLFKTELGRSEYHLMTTSIVFSVALMIGGIAVGSMKFTSIKSTVIKGIYAMSATFALLALSIFLVTYSIIGYWIFFAVYLLISIGLAMFMSLTNIPLNTAMIKAIEPSFRGRVFSIIQALATGAIPLAMVLGGVIISLSNTAFLGLFCTLAMLYPMLGFTRNSKVMTFFESLDKEENARLQEAN